LEPLYLPRGGHRFCPTVTKGGKPPCVLLAFRPGRCVLVWKSIGGAVVNYPEADRERSYPSQARRLINPINMRQYHLRELFDGGRNDVSRDAKLGLSPLLANVALSVLDEHFAEAWASFGANHSARSYRRRKGKANYRLVRYADVSSSWPAPEQTPNVCGT
jgi:hypothetical protein